MSVTKQREERAQREIGVREMPRNGSSSRLEVNANQAAGPLRAATHNLFHSQAHWVYIRVPIREIKMKIPVDSLMRRAILAIVVADLVTATSLASGMFALCGFGWAVIYFVVSVLFTPFWPLNLLPGASPRPEDGWPIFALFATLALAFFLLQRSALSPRQLVTISLGLLLLAVLAGYGSYKLELMPFGQSCK